MEFAGIVVAAGSGSRAGGDKQWRALGGRPVLRWSVEALLDAGAAEVVVVLAPGAEDRAAQALDGLAGWRSVPGGVERTDSVRTGLAALSLGPEAAVLIHDAARPLLSGSVVRALLAALRDHEGALPALPVADSLKRGEGGLSAGAVDRAGLYRAQTPQAFRHAAIRAAFDAWTGGPAGDDVEVLEANGGRVALIPGDPALMKLTYPEDFAMAEALIPHETRMGLGLDAHRWGPGDTVWLCGVPIQHDQTLLGHSDADAGLHALTDAILGALGAGDIGDHFPPTDPKWKGAASDQFLVHAVDMVRQRGGRLVNVDVTLVCEQPRIKPHRQAMRERLAELLGLPLDAVSVKATTMEGMGFTGRQEGLAAQAIAAVSLPVSA